MPATDVASYQRNVEMPTVQHLLNGGLAPVRAAIRSTTPERDPQQWVALNLILGTALRLRAHKLPLRERTTACIEALAAFESALAQCCDRKAPRQLRGARVATNQFSVHT